MTKFFTSDLHRYHRNVINYCNRPFRDVIEMDNYLIEMWCKTVSNDDIVYVIGDVSLNPKHADVNSFPGYKILIPGNHDGCFKFLNRSEEKYNKMLKKYNDLGWNEIHQILELDLKNNIKVLLSHLPYNTIHGNKYDQRYQEYKPIDNGLVLLHGHLHCRYKKKGRMIDVGIDDDFNLLSEDKVIELINDSREFIPSRITEFYNNRVDIVRDNMRGLKDD